jgi:O-antigen/teichoic acid export membrane protein
VFKKVAYNTGAQVVGKFVTAAATLLVTIIIGRSLGEAGYGNFTKIFTFVGYFYTFADFGINTIYVKTATEKTEQYLLKVLVGLRIIMAVLLIVAVFLIGNLLPYNASSGIGFSPLVKIGITLAALTILTQAIYTSFNAFFQKKLRYDLSAIAAVVGALAILVGAFFCAYFKTGLLGFSGIYVIGGAVTVLSAAFIIHRYFKINLNPSFNKEKSLEFLKTAWPVGVALVLNLIYFRVDVLILSLVRNSTEVGLYGLAYQFFEASLAVPIFFSNALYPLLIDVKKQNTRLYFKQVKNWLKILTAVSLLQTAALFVISFIIPLLYNGQFRGSVLALQVLSLGIPFFFLSALLWHCLIIAGRQKHLMYIYGAGALFNLFSNIILIPKYGYLAAAIVTITSEGLILLLLALDYAYSKKDLTLET